MKKPVFAIVGVLALVSSGAVMAADLPPPIVGKAAPYVAPMYFSWTGFYVGGNAGYGWGSGSGTVTFTTLAPAGATGPFSGSGNGFLGGVQAGYNWQMGSFVFGGEVDFQLSEASGTFSGRAGAVTFNGSARNLWFGTGRGRIGYAFDRWLVYGTGGGYVAENKASGIDSLGRAFNARATGWGWTLGGGLEWAVAPSWSIKAEYLYLNTPDKVPTRAGTTMTGSADTHVARGGVNFRF